jgi:hypothetical protein
MDFGTFLLLVGFSYGIGVFWYDLLPAKLAEKPWRVAAYPFLGIVMAHAMMPAEYHGPAFASMHVVPALFGSLVGVLVDCLVTGYRHPAAISAPEVHARA